MISFKVFVFIISLDFDVQKHVINPSPIVTDADSLIGGMISFVFVEYFPGSQAEPGNEK